MNFSQMHERLRQELLRRLQRGTVSVSLLARQAGLTPAHVSNFLQAKRRLSLEALDRVLESQRLALGDLLPSGGKRVETSSDADRTLVPLLSQPLALFEPILRPGMRQECFPAPARLLESLHPCCAPGRRRWERFVALRVSASDAAAMDPVLTSGSIVVIDRHYTSLQAYRPGRANIYALRAKDRLTLRYVECVHRCLILRPHASAVPVELLDLTQDEAPGERIAGRLVLLSREC